MSKQAVMIPLIVLIASNGLNIDFVYKHIKNGRDFVFDTKYLKKELNDVLITNSEILSLLRKKILSEIKRIKVGL